MEKIILKDLESINWHYAQRERIRGINYNNDDKSLVFECVKVREEDEEKYIRNKEENEILQISFKYVKCFHLPVNFYFPIDEINLVPESDIEKFSPFFDKETISKDKNYQYYQFIIIVGLDTEDEERVETDFYVYCTEIKGELILNYTEYALSYTNNLGELISPCDNRIIDAKNNKAKEICYQSYGSIEDAKNAGKIAIKNPLINTCYIRFGDNYELILQAEQENFELSYQTYEYTEEDNELITEEDNELTFDNISDKFLTLMLIKIIEMMHCTIEMMYCTIEKIQKFRRS